MCCGWAVGTGGHAIRPLGEWGGGEEAGIGGGCKSGGEEAAQRDEVEGERAADISTRKGMDQEACAGFLSMHYALFMLTGIALSAKRTQVKR